MTFRHATAQDAVAIAALHTLSWQVAYRGVFSDYYLDQEAAQERLQAWEARFANPPADLWVLLAEEEDTLLGFVCLTPQEEPAHGVMLDNLHVRAGQQGKGIGKKLLRRAHEWVKQQFPGQPMFLYVLQANTPAIAFYEAIGGQLETDVPDWDAPGGQLVKVFRYVFGN